MDKVLTAIKELIEELVENSSSPLYYHESTNSNGIKRVYKGDPKTIPNSEFPVVVVRPVTSSWVRRQSRYDRKEHVVEVIIVDNMSNYKDDGTDPEKAPIVGSISAMVDMMEKTDEAQKTLATTILGKLSLNPKLPYSYTTIEQTTTEYAAEDLRPDSIDYVFNSSRGFPSFEVIARFTVTSQGDRATS